MKRGSDRLRIVIRRRQPAFRGVLGKGLVISVLSIVPARISEKACAIGRLLIEGREFGERG